VPSPSDGLCGLRTSETYLAFFQATVHSPVHPVFDSAPGPDCAWETGFAPSGASQPIADGKPTFHSESILCAPSTRDAHRSPWGNLGLLPGPLHGRSSTERFCCRRRFCEPPPPGTPPDTPIACTRSDRSVTPRRGRKTLWTEGKRVTAGAVGMWKSCLPQDFQARWEQLTSPCGACSSPLWRSRFHGASFPQRFS
jgi:hypothetical protein